MELHGSYENRIFLTKVNDWRDRLSVLVDEMTSEHKELSDAPVKDFSIAVMYQEFLLASIGFLRNADETLSEYMKARLEEYNNKQKNQEDELCQFYIKGTR